MRRNHKLHICALDTPASIWFLDASDAEDELLSSLDGKPTANPEHLRFTTGKRKQFWNKNCVAIGLSADFMEPLEPTSLHFIQYGIMRQLALFANEDMSPPSAMTGALALLRDY
jgi:tryptophan halogenase